MSEPLRAGVIGCGMMGQAHARLYSEISKTELVAVMDTDPARARELGLAHDCAHFASLDDFGEAELDLVSVCVDDRFHVEPCVRMAELGRHLLVEKPLALTVGDCDIIMEAVEAAGVTLMVGHCVRFDPRYHEAHLAISRGELGEISHAYARRTNTRATARRIGGRVELPFYLGVHDIDILRWLVGSEVTRVAAVASRKVLAGLGMGVADAYYATLGFASGAIGCLDLSWTTPDSLGWKLDAACHVAGTRGVVRIDFADEGFVWSTEDEAVAGGVTYGYEVAGRLRGALHAEVAHFVDCIEHGRRPLVSSADARRAVEIAEAMVRSAETGVPVELP
jgi:predicted dehydrogenase